MSEVAVPSAPEPPPAKSFVSRLIGVFLSPGETFEDIARKPDFIAPLVLSVVASVAVVETMLWKIGAEAIVRSQMAANPRAASMSPEQMEQAVQRGATITAIIMHISGVIGPAIFLMIIAALGILILNVVLGGQVKFKPVFSATCYASLIRLIGAVMAVPLIFFGDQEHFNVQNPLPTNPGFFLNASEVAKPLYAAASSLDLMTFWFLIVLAIGLSKITGGKVKTASVFLCYLALWFLVTLVQVGLAALF